MISPKGGDLSPIGHPLLLLLEKLADLAEESFLLQVGHDSPGRVKKKWIEGNGSPIFFDDHAIFSPYRGEPLGDLIAVPYGGGQKQQVYPGREVDHDLLPDDAPVRVSKEMGLVEDDKVAVQVFPAVHHIIELVSQYLRCADDYRRSGVLLGVACQDANVCAVELESEFHPLGIGERLQGRAVPAPSAAAKDGEDRLFGDPGFS